MEAPDPAPLSPARMLARGLARRCPLCGSGHMFRSFFLVKERCPRCNFPIHREEGHWIGAIGMNTVVSFGALLITLLVVFALTWDDRSGAAVFIPAFAVALVVPIVFFGPSQTLWSAIDLWMRPLEPGDDVDPRYLPPRRPR
ncbi:MAG: hypothetical protein ACRDYW_07935 [Acidimicrobiales bacterium]